MKSKRKESGVAAVEFALVAPILFSVICGIVEFGAAYNYRTQLHNAVQAGARDMAIHRDAGQARTRVRNAMGLPNSQPVTVTGTCPAIEAPAKNTVVVSLTVNKPAITNLFGTSFNIGARASAVCM